MGKSATRTGKPATPRRAYGLLGLALILFTLALALPASASASAGGPWQSPLPQGTSPVTSASLMAAAASPLPCLRWEPNLLTLLAVQQAELTNPDAARGDSWGCSVAISGETALVGAAGTARSSVRATGRPVDKRRCRCSSSTINKLQATWFPSNSADVEPGACQR